jgi:hypothetical protein
VIGPATADKHGPRPSYLSALAGRGTGRPATHARWFWLKSPRVAKACSPCRQHRQNWPDLAELPPRYVTYPSDRARPAGKQRNSGSPHGRPGFAAGISLCVHTRPILPVALQANSFPNRGRR